MINLPPLGDHIRDSEIIAAIFPPLGDEWPLAVNGNEKAVIWRSGRILDVYSEGRKTVPADAGAVVSTLRQRRMTVAFGDIAHFHGIHVQRPQFPNLGGFAVDISFSLVRNDRVNVQRLFTLDKARAEVIAVQDLANGLSSLPVSIRNEVADAMNSHRRSSEPYRTNYKFIAEIERRIQKTTDSSFREYGISATSVEVTIAATICPPVPPPPPPNGPPPTAFWVYEDDPTNRARVHRGDCRYCNPCGIRKPDNRWHGPYATSADAFAIMRRLGKRDTGGCGTCRP